MTLLHRIMRKMVSTYRRWEEREVLQRIPNSLRNNVRIEYPFIISHAELMSIGKNTTILSNARIQAYPELSREQSTLEIGADCYFGHRLCILVGGDIAIGNNVLMASDVSIVSHNHGMNPESDIPYMEQQLEARAITIGDNCWIGDKALILAGVSIGHDSIIGGGSVVTKDIPPMSIAVGNPARVIKQYDVEAHEWKRV